MLLLPSSEGNSLNINEVVMKKILIITSFLLTASFLSAKECPGKEKRAEFCPGKEKKAEFCPGKEK